MEWFIVYFLMLEVFRTKRQIYLFIFILIFTSIATLFDGLVQYYITQKDFFLGHIISVGGRPTAAFKTSNGLGSYLSVLIPILGVLWFSLSEKFWLKILTFTVFLVSLWVLVLTFSRGAWIGMIMGCALGGLIVLFHKKKSNLIISFSFLFIGFVCLVTFFFMLAQSSYSSLLIRNATVSWRMDIWLTGIEMIKDRPLFGHGINTFMTLFEQYRLDSGSNPTYAHNCFIQLAVEVGLVGLIGFLFIIIKLFQYFLCHFEIMLSNDQNAAYLAVGIFSGISAFIVHSLFDTNLYSLQLSAYLWCMIGLLMALLKIDQSENAQVLVSSGLGLK